MVKRLSSISADASARICDPPCSSTAVPTHPRRITVPLVAGVLSILVVAPAVGGHFAVFAGPNAYDADQKSVLSAIEADFAKISGALAGNKISTARNMLSLTQGRVGKLKGKAYRDKKREYKTRITEAHRVIEFKEDSLLNRNLEILSKEGIKSAIDFMERTLRVYGVNEKKFRSIDKAIMEAAPLFQQGPVASDAPLELPGDEPGAGLLTPEQIQALGDLTPDAPSEPPQDVAAESVEEWPELEADAVPEEAAPASVVPPAPTPEPPAAPAPVVVPAVVKETPPAKKAPQPPAPPDAEAPIAAREHAVEPKTVAPEEAPAVVLQTTATGKQPALRKAAPLPPEPVVTRNTPSVPEPPVTEAAPSPAPEPITEQPPQATFEPEANEPEISPVVEQPEPSAKEAVAPPPKPVAKKPPAQRVKEPKRAKPEDAQKMALLREKQVRETTARREKVLRRVAAEQERVKKRISRMRKAAGAPKNEPVQAVISVQEPPTPPPAQEAVKSEEDATHMSFTIYNWIIEKRTANARELFQQNSAGLKQFMAPEAFAALEAAVQDAAKSTPSAVAAAPQPRHDSVTTVAHSEPIEGPGPSMETPDERLAAKIYLLLSQEKVQDAYNLFQKSKRKLQKGLESGKFQTLQSRVEREYGYLKKLKL